MNNGVDSCARFKSASAGTVEHVRGSINRHARLSSTVSIRITLEGRNIAVLKVEQLGDQGLIIAMLKG
jgi:hypothetical protein